MTAWIPALLAAWAVCGCAPWSLAGRGEEGLRVPGAPREVLRPGGAWETSSKRVIPFHRMVTALDPVPVVFVGETHNREEDHRIQLRILRLLNLPDRRLMVAMEMFQARRQKALDDYLSGAMDEAALAKAVDWPRSWGYDLEMYAPILRYARDHGIPVLALNAPPELVRRVARDGREGLSDEEKAALPAPWPIPSEAYGAFLRRQFEAHPHAPLRSPERFVEAQLLWDGFMAQTLAQAMAAHQGPRRLQVLVLAGRGHVGRGTGIPRALQDRMSLEYRVVMPVEAGELDGLDLSWADYLVPVFPHKDSEQKSHKDQSGY